MICVARRRFAPGTPGDGMLYELVNFSDQVGPLNVFRYITFRTGGAIMTALLFVFLFGPAMIDELEWIREDRKLTPDDRDKAVDDLIELVGAVDGILQVQSRADVAFFVSAVGRHFSDIEEQQLKDGVLGAYRWQYIVTGVQHPRFQEILGSLITPEQSERIGKALAPIL